MARRWMAHEIASGSAEYLNNLRGFLRENGIEFEEEDNGYSVSIYTNVNKDEWMKIEDFKHDQITAVHPHTPTEEEAKEAMAALERVENREKRREALTPENVEAVYTGGNIWLFTGELADGNYFLTDDNGATLILDADPLEDFEEACCEEWQTAHRVEELEGEDRDGFNVRMLDTLRTAPTGGITEDEIDAYKAYMLGY